MNTTSQQARTIALIASLSAFAVMGRMLFAAFPNIKPVSALIIMSGAVFGPRIGFAVAVCTTLVSNLFFGHGPWTFWQMAAWGLMGLVSGFLGKWLTNGPAFFRITYGFVWGFLFGWIMNSWTWWAYYPHTWQSWITVCAQSVVFDLAHALANVGFLGIGWPLIKPMQRFKVKLNGVVSGILVVCLSISFTMPIFSKDAVAAEPQTRSMKEVVTTALSDVCPVLRNLVKSSADADAWLALSVNAIAALPQQKCNITIPSPTMLEDVNPYTSLTDLERELIGLSSYKDSDAIRKLRFLYQDAIRQAQQVDGAFADQVNGKGNHLVNAHIYGLLSLYASGANVLHQKEAITYLRSVQHADGSFNWSKSTSAQAIPDADMTAMALIAAKTLDLNRDDPLVERAFQWLHQRQNANGGFLSAKLENVESNASVLQAILCWNEALSDWTTADQKTPLDGILSFQQTDGGFSHLKNGRTNPMSTIQAATALIAWKQDKSIFDWLHSRSASMKPYSMLFRDVQIKHKKVHSIALMVLMNWMPPFDQNQWKPDQKISVSFIATFIKSVDPDGSLHLAKSIPAKPTKSLTRAEWADLVNQWMKKI